jgi:hypothetical protein
MCLRACNTRNSGVICFLEYRGLCLIYRKSLPGRSIFVKNHVKMDHSQLLTTTARVQCQVRACEICGGQSGTGTRFVLVLQFPMPVLISQSPLTGGWYNRPNSDWHTKYTQSHPTL